MSQYVPTVLKDPVVNAIALTIVPAILYTGAAYGQLFIKNIAFGMALLISIVFAILEYIVRVPIIQYSGKVAKMSNISMQAVWVIETLILAGVADAIRDKFDN